MNKLEKDWLTDKWIDFEYKKYVLLAYISHVKEAFNLIELYPGLSDAISQYRYLKDVRDKIVSVSGEFPKSLELQEIKKSKLSYESMISDQTIDELMKIIDFSIPKVKEVIEEGRNIYEFIEGGMSIEPVGVVPLYTNEGYLFAQVKTDKKMAIYRYEIRLFEGFEGARGVSLLLIQNLKWNYTSTLRSLKVKLAKKYKDLPNPAAYLVTSSDRYPDNSTFLPIAKRMLVKNLSM